MIRPEEDEGVSIHARSSALDAIVETPRSTCHLAKPGTLAGICGAAVGINVSDAVHVSCAACLEMIRAEQDKADIAVLRSIAKASRKRLGFDQRTRLVNRGLVQWSRDGFVLTDAGRDRLKAG